MINDGAVGVLKIAVSSSVELGLIMSPVTELKKHLSDLELKIMRAPGAQVTEFLKSGDAELAIAAAIGDAWDRLDRWPLFEEPFDLFLSRRLKFAGDTADRAQLAEETLLIDMRCEMAGALAHRLEALGLGEMRRHQLASQSDVLSLVEANFGVAILPVGSAQADAIRRVTLPGLDLARTVSAYCVAGRRRGSAAATLLNMLRAAEWPADRSREWRPRKSWSPRTQVCCARCRRPSRG